MSRDEFRRRLATAEGRASLGVALTAEQAALVLADDARLDLLFAGFQQMLAEQEARSRGEQAAAAWAAAVGPAAAAPRVAPSPRRVSPSERVVFSGVAVLCVIATVFGIVTIAAPRMSSTAAARTTTPSSTATAEETPYVAPERDYPLLGGGYADAGNGLQWRVEDPALYGGCQDHGRCILVVLQAFHDCRGGVAVAADVVDDSRTVVGQATGTLPVLFRGDKGLVRLEITPDAGTGVLVTSVECRTW